MPEELEEKLDINEFRAWLTEKGNEHVGFTVSEYADPIGNFFHEQHAMLAVITDTDIVVPTDIHIPHKPWSKRFVSLLRNEYAGHDWVSGRDALSILDRAEKGGK